jgi:predicted nucleic acid-binding protein
VALVFDAGVALKLLLPEERSDQAIALLGAAVQRREPIAAPYLLTAEIVNAIRRRTRRGRFPLTDAMAALD